MSCIRRRPLDPSALARSLGLFSGSAALGALPRFVLQDEFSCRGGGEAQEFGTRNAAAPDLLSPVQCQRHKSPRPAEHGGERKAGRRMASHPTVPVQGPRHIKTAAVHPPQAERHRDRRPCTVALVRVAGGCLLRFGLLQRPGVSGPWRSGLQGARRAGRRFGAPRVCSWVPALAGRQGVAPLDCMRRTCRDWRPAALGRSRGSLREVGLPSSRGGRIGPADRGGRIRSF